LNREEYAQMYALEETHFWCVARRNLALNVVRKLRTARPKESPLRILDMGCGTGGMLERLHPMGEAWGIDVEPLALAFCRERLPDLRVALASATALPFPANVFDTVVALDVLEHIEDHEAATREVFRVLRPGGTFIVTVPAYRFLWSRHDEALMHRRRYTATEMRTLLTGAGFAVPKLSYAVTSLLPVIAAVRFFSRWKRDQVVRSDLQPLPTFANNLLRTVLETENKIVAGSGLPFGVTVFAVAKKPPS